MGWNFPTRNDEYKRKWCRLRNENLLHCWQNLCLSPATITTGAFEWNSHTLWRRWYFFASVKSAPHLSAWQEGGETPPPPPLLPPPIPFFFSSSVRLSSSSTSFSASSSTALFLLTFSIIIVLFLSILLASILLWELRWQRLKGRG